MNKIAINQPIRKSIRLTGYDYSQNGVYFVTICVQNRAGLFGEILHESMQLNEAGKMIQSVWQEIPIYYRGWSLDVFQVMPNHVHGILTILEASDTTLSLSDIIHRYKVLTTKKYIDGVKKHHWKPFEGKLWQRSYYEHILRHEDALYKAQEYIINNPINWPKDKMNLSK